MRGLLAFGLALLPLLSACLDVPGTGHVSSEPFPIRTLAVPVASGVRPENRSAEEYYFVMVRGEENLSRISGKELAIQECHWKPPFEYDVAQERVRYDSSRFAVTPNVAILVGVQALGVKFLEGAAARCPDPLSLVAYEGRAMVQTFVRDIEIHLVVEARNGFVSYNQSYFLGMDQKLHVNYTRIVDHESGRYYLTGDFEIINWGAFPRKQLEPFPSEPGGDRLTEPS